MKEEVLAINSVAREVFQIAVDHGFHDKDVLIIVPTACEHGEVGVDRMGAFCSNLHGEVSELWEATRHGTLRAPCNKGIPLTNAEEELADIVIRAMDTAVTLGIDLGRAIQIKSGYNESREFMHGKKA